MTRDELAKKYAVELNAFPAPNFEERWIELLRDLASLSESNWDFTSIRYGVVMSLPEWKDFSQHPERIQYKSKISRFKDADYQTEVFDFITEVVKDSYALLVTLDPSEFKELLKMNTAALFDYSLNAKYQTDEIRISDRYYGRKDEDRDMGIVDPTSLAKQRLEYAIYEYCLYNDIDFEELFNKIQSITDGRITTLVNYYLSCSIESEFRKSIYEILQIYDRDKTLLLHRIQFGWQVWKGVREMGLDTDKWLSLIGFPGLDTTLSRLVEFLEDKELIDETLKHLEDDLPETYQKYLKTGEISRYDIWQETADRKKYPTSLKNSKETLQMIEECEEEVYKTIPLTKKKSEKYIIFNAVHPEGSTRASASATKNEKGELVSAIVMTPNADQKDDYLETFAHESIHGIHRVTLSLGEVAGVLQKGAQERVSSATQEMFTLLIQEQFAADESLPYTKKFKGKEYGSFLGALSTRHQSPVALIQITSRVFYDKLWDEGQRGALTSEHVQELDELITKEYARWYSIGLRVSTAGSAPLSRLDPYNPDDGLVYLGKHIIKSEKKTEVDSTSVEKSDDSSTGSAISMSDAFKQRFGEKWIGKRDSKIILYWLFLESGRNTDTESYGQMVLDLDIEKCVAELYKIGIEDSDIGEDL